MKRFGLGGGARYKRVEVGGLPIYHVPDEGPTRAALMFRVGRGDKKTAPISGVTHLVEHLALFPLGQQRFDYNGFVDPIRTMFVAAGDEAEVAGYLATLCRNLSALPLDRLATEQRVLRDEASRRSVGPPDHHGWLRWGLHGPGLGFIPEYGLWRLGAPDVERWAREWFTSGNAALVWVGKRLPALDLPLPPGERRHPRPLVDLLDAPAWAVGAPDHVTVSFTLKRDSAEAAAQRILGKRLQQKLRYERGLSYDVSVHYQPLSAELATSTMWASCGPQDATAVRDVVIQAAGELAATGPTVDELAADLDAMRRSREHPFAGQGEADRLAIQELLGAPAETLDFLQDELARVTPDSARDAFRAAMPTGIVTHPRAPRTRPSGWPPTRTSPPSCSRAARSGTARIRRCRSCGGSRGSWSERRASRSWARMGPGSASPTRMSPWPCATRASCGCSITMAPRSTSTRSGGSTAARRSTRSLASSRRSASSRSTRARRWRARPPGRRTLRRTRAGSHDTRVPSGSPSPSSR